MEISDFFKQHWDVIINAPSTFIACVVLTALISVTITRALLSGALDACRERLEQSKDDILRLKGEKGELTSRLESHGEDIQRIKADLVAMPRIHTSDRPPGPDDGKDGDIWFQHEK